MKPEEPLLVSHSQMGVFNRCGYKWHLGYQEGWSNKHQPDYFLRGGMIHEALAEYYEAIKNGHVQLGDEKPLKVQINKWIKAGNYPVEMINEVSQIVGRYIRDYSIFEDKGVEIVDVEERFIADLTTPKGRPYQLQGIIDLLIKVNGRYFVVDHKSTGNSSFRSEEALLMDSQLPTYVHLLRDEGVDVFGMVFNFLNTYSYKDRKNTPVDKLFKRVNTYRTEHEMQVIMREIGRTVDEMYEKRHQPRRAFGFDCDRCNMQELCLMDMRGIDLDRETPVNFKRNPKKMVAPYLDYNDEH